MRESCMMYIVSQKAITSLEVTDADFEKKKLLLANQLHLTLTKQLYKNTFSQFLTIKISILNNTLYIIIMMVTRTPNALFRVLPSANTALIFQGGLR